MSKIWPLKEVLKPEVRFILPWQLIKILHSNVHTLCRFIAKAAQLVIRQFFPNVRYMTVLWHNLYTNSPLLT
jgi:hypothetical protein